METLSTEMRYADIGSDNKIVIAKICQVRKTKLGTCNSKQFDVHNLKTQMSKKNSPSPSETDTAHSKMRQLSLSTNSTRPWMMN